MSPPRSPKKTPPALFLVGYRASGKTTIGRELARRLRRDFADTDDLVAREFGMEISECFRRHGEERFRHVENEILRHVVESAARGPGLVVSTGGGIVLDPENVRLMRSTGTVIWLRATPRTLRRRLESDAATATSRPSLTGSSVVGEVESVLEAREPLYRTAAHLTIGVDPPGTPGEIVEEIVTRL